MGGRHLISPSQWIAKDRPPPHSHEDRSTLVGLGALHALLSGRKKARSSMSSSLNPKRNSFGWFGRLRLRAVGEKEEKPSRTGFHISSPYYDALDTSVSQDAIAYALFHGTPGNTQNHETLNPEVYREPSGCQCQCWWTEHCLVCWDRHLIPA